MAPAGPPFGGTRSCGCRGSAGTAPLGGRGADAVSGAGLQLFARLLCRRAHRHSRTGRRPGRDAVQPGLCMVGAGPRQKTGGQVPGCPADPNLQRGHDRAGHFGNADLKTPCRLSLGALAREVGAALPPGMAKGSNFCFLLYIFLNKYKIDYRN